MQADPQGPDATQLAVQRTVLAAERTLLAWVRTALSMIGFGFTIYKFFQYLTQSQGLARPHAPRNLGLTLIALGTLTLMGALYQYRRMLQRIGGGAESTPGGMLLAIVLLMALVGVLTFASIYFRTGPF
ncbi:MAG TPA: DUF202 domain-containing protein [Stenomitos sp.]